jgi:uncharacterized protein YndB with AHSA1/START domain
MTVSLAVDPIELAFETPAHADLVWTYLTEPGQVAEWFTDVVPVGAVGDPYRLDFGDGSIVEGVILELEPGRRFAYRWAWTDAEPAAARPTRVEWRVEALPGGGSRVVLRHDGWSEAATDDAIRDDHEAYWSGYLDDLRDLLEEAAGSPV